VAPWERELAVVEELGVASRDGVRNIGHRDRQERVAHSTQDDIPNSVRYFGLAPRCLVAN
jgi:hypothetical protein